MATATTGVVAVDDMRSLADIIVRFIIIFGGGALTGLIVGLLSGLLQRKAGQDLLSGVMSLMVAYGSYLLAEYFEVSGVMSTLLAALSYSMLGKDETASSGKNDESALANKYLWRVLSHVANVSVFLMMGAVITMDMFEQRWLAMLIAIFSLLLARAASVYGVLVLFALFKDLRVSFPAQTVMVWGGLRGAVTLALALSLPTSLDYWWTIQSIAFGVVTFSLFVQAPTMQLLVKKLSFK
jgi:CPA1 family monovalent cation:H+ antiporter